jgi:hypothetical protein
MDTCSSQYSEMGQRASASHIAMCVLSKVASLKTRMWHAATLIGDPASHADFLTLSFLMEVLRLLIMFDGSTALSLDQRNHLRKTILLKLRTLDRVCPARVNAVDEAMNLALLQPSSALVLWLKVGQLGGSLHGSGTVSIGYALFSCARPMISICSFASPSESCRICIPSRLRESTRSLQYARTTQTVYFEEIGDRH